ncbi:MAG: phenylacetate--CoA ligase [Deltaproteobacteria bacterium RBG_13_49_15]|nr:MAG: phenylacetate--CoA ligase [Deltaproteobacteria bacterium RBG_13_49_15]
MFETFMPLFKNRDELDAHRLKGLKWTVNHAYNGSAFYRKRLDEAGLRPGDIASMEDIRRLPLTTAEDLRSGYPFPLLSIPESEVVRIHASSGTTGKKKVLTYSQKDIDDWAFMFARCYEMGGVTRRDRVQIAVGYGIWTAGVGFQLGCERLGAMSIPVGPGNIDMQCQFLEDLKSTVICCTASMGLLMAEEVCRRNLKDKIALKRMIFGSERSGDAMRRRIKDLLGLEDMFDITGMTELYGPGTGLDCARHEGIHYWADYYILEILDPETLEPVSDGQVGEMVVTTLCKEAAPLIRYRTRDLTRKIDHPCSCGSLLPLHDRILGRSDDMIIFRGVNIYPGQIDQILSETPEIGSEYQVVLSRGKEGKDHMLLRVETQPDVPPSSRNGIKKAIAEKVKKTILVSSTVEIVEYGTLPRSERKSKRIFDERPQ